MHLVSQTFRKTNAMGPEEIGGELSPKLQQLGSGFGLRKIERGGAMAATICTTVNTKM